MVPRISIKFASNQFPRIPLRSYICFQSVDMITGGLKENVVIGRLIPVGTGMIDINGLKLEEPEE